MRAIAVALVFFAGWSANAAELPHVIDSIKGADGPWDYATVDPELHRLYVARGDGVMAVKLDDQAVIPILVPGGRVHGIALVPGGLAVSANGDSSSATLFKTADGSVVAEFPAGKKADAVVRDPKTGLVGIMNSKDGTVTLINVTERKPVGLITVGGTLEFAVADDQGRVFVNVEDKNELALLDFAAAKVTARYPLAPCDGPTGLALDPAHGILLSACANGKAVAVSAKDGHILATLPIGSHPDAAMFDAARSRFLVPCGGDGVLNVIAVAADGSLSSQGAAPTAKGARTGAVDPASGRIYLPTADFAAALPGARPSAVPGSFRILVLAP